MSQVAPGGKSGSRSGSTQGQGAPGKRPPAKAPAKKRPPAPSAGRSGPGGKGPRPPGPGGAKGRGPRPNTVVSARPPRRFSASTMAFAAVSVVVVIVVVFVVVKITGNSSPSSSTSVAAPVLTPASPTVVSQVTGVSSSVISTVGTGGDEVSAPQTLSGQPALTSAGKPEVLAVLAEFCPYCAAERWSMVQAFSRFGTWSGLNETTSSPWDNPSAIATFSFADATFTSPYFDFVSVEHESNDTNGLGTRTVLQPLTSKQSNLWSTYSGKFGVEEGFPFVDFGNRIFVIGPSYNPATILLGLNQNQIASKLTNAKDPVTQAIVGTANYLTAAVCSLTNDQPTSVCSAAGVRQAATAMKLG